MSRKLSVLAVALTLRFKEWTLACRLTILTNVISFVGRLCELRIFASHYALPPQGSAAWLGPDYTHRPVSTGTFRQLLQLVLPALEGVGASLSLHRIADAAYVSALSTS